MSTVTRTFEIPRDHPVFAGHYPGFPLLPGLFLLEYALLTVPGEVVAVDRVRFLNPVRPGDAVTVTATGGTVVVSTAGGKVADIRLRCAP